MKFNAKKITLKNGLRLIVVPQKESPSATVGIFVQTGSAYENSKNNGISHFLEHMCFKGTNKRPNPIDISSELESLGASHNAFTSRDLTGYWAKVAYTKFNDVFDVLADMYLNPKFEEKEIKKERGVIIEEMNMYKDQPRASLEWALDDLMYKNQPAGWKIVGTEKVIKSISRKDFFNYRKLHYNASKTVVVVAGNIDEKKVKSTVEKYFLSLNKGKIIEPKKVSENQENLEMVIVKKDLDQTHLVLGIKSFSSFSPKRYALGIMADILGGGLSSRLFQRVREELGAAYYVGASPELYGTHGYLDIHAGVNHQKTDLALKAIIEELKRISKEKVSDAELKRVKDHNIGTFLLSLETSSSLAFFAGEQEVTKKQIETPDQMIKKLSSVSKEDVLAVAKEIFKNNKLNFAIIGPYSTKDTTRFRKIITL